MSLPYQLYCCCLLLCSLSTLQTRAQSDTLPSHLALNNAIQQYHSYLTPEPGLYKGSQYVVFPFPFKEGHPYFDQDHMQTGSVLYNGILYKNVPLIYDLVRGLLVTFDVSKTFKISFINQQVDSFTIQNHLFVHLKDSLNPALPRHGFYEVLYNGRTTLLKKEKKSIREDLSFSTINRYVDANPTAYYLKKDSTWYTIYNRKGLFRAFRDKSQELKKFLRSNKIRFKDDKDNTLIKSAAWYDSLRP
jgi:hypothetical protein